MKQLPRKSTKLTMTELIVAELRQRREFLEQLAWPGRLIIHINPESADRPVTIEVQVRV